MDQPPVLALVLYNLRYFTEHITLNLDFQKCIQMLMTGVIDAKVIKLTLFVINLTLFICFGPAKSWNTTGHLYLKHYMKLLTWK